MLLSLLPDKVVLQQPCYHHIYLGHKWICLSIASNQQQNAKLGLILLDSRKKSRLKIVGLLVFKNDIRQ